MSKHKGFKVDDVPGEKIAKIRKLARQGVTPGEAMVVIDYPYAAIAFVRMCRREWRIEFVKNWNRAHEGHLADEVSA